MFFSYRCRLSAIFRSLPPIPTTKHQQRQQSFFEDNGQYKDNSC